MDKTQNKLKTAKKQIAKTILVIASFAMFVAAVVLVCTKGIILFFNLKFIALIFLTPLPICIAFHNEIMEASYKLEKEKEKEKEAEERKKEPHDTWDYLPMPYYPPAW